jgi:hypothetical protein
MCRKLICLFSVVFVLTLVCTSYADIVIGDFEDGTEGWVATNGTSIDTSDIGATLGSKSLVISDVPANNFTWAVQREGLVDMTNCTTISVDITWVAAEWDPQEGIWVNFKDMAINSDGPSGWTQYIPTDVVNPDWPGSWDPANWGDQTRTLTYDVSGYDATGATFMQVIFSTHMGGVTTPGNYYIDNVVLIGAEPIKQPEPGPKVIFVASVKDNDADGIQDDISWANWLTAEGYDVDFRPGNWIDPLDPNKIAELEAADLIIAGRGMSTGEYDGDETAKWNALSTPILCTNAWMIRSNRWKWMNSSSANKDAGAPLMLVLDPTNPIFEGVPVDGDGLVEILDPTVGSGHTSFLTDILDVGNGTLIAQSLGIYNTTWIAEWAAGVEYYEGAGEIAGGKRVLFMAGTQDDPYTVPDSTLIMPVGVFNLNEAGQQLLRNIIAYLTAEEPVAIPVENASFELPGTTKQNNWDGGTNAKGTFEDVPGWSSDTMAEDSGVESDWPGSTEGVWTGFMMGSDPSAWNLTDHVISAGEVLTLKVDLQDNWTDGGAPEVTISLYYDDAGTRVTMASATVTPSDQAEGGWAEFSVSVAADDVPDSIGKLLGVEIDNVSATNSWIGMDNVRITVN